MRARDFEGENVKAKPRYAKLKYANVEQALRNAAGIQSVAAEKLGVHRSTVSLFVRKHPKLALVIEEITETALDLAESKLLVAIGKGDTRAIIYFLENKGQGRGYGKRGTEFTDVEGNTLRAATLTAPLREVDAEEWARLNMPTTIDLRAIEDATPADSAR